MRPIACGVVDEAQCVDCVLRVRLSVRHEDAALLQPVAERIHLSVDEQRRQVLNSDSVRLVLYAQRFRETLQIHLHIGLVAIDYSV